MFKTSMRSAFETALRDAPVGKVQQFVRRGVAHGSGTKPPKVVRKKRLPQIWSSPKAHVEFFGAKTDESGRK